MTHMQATQLAEALREFVEQMLRDREMVDSDTCGARCGDHAVPVLQDALLRTFGEVKVES